MPEFCPQDYRPASAQSGERLQFFSSNGRDWQQECNQGREGTAERWQQLSADIWTDRGDLPPVLADFVTRQQQAIEQGDKLDPRQILNNVEAGFDRKMQVDLQIASKLAKGESPASTLLDAQNKQDWENWNNFKDYLSPAGKRASMGFALISSGIDRHIKEGERMLVEAVRLRPELQFNEDFQKRVVQSYRDMARTRIDMGLPMYRGAPQLEPVNSGRQPILGTDPALPLLGDARKQAQERGIKNATQQYDRAITESDNKDFSTIKGVRLATFVQRLLLDRAIIESEERGLPSGHLRNQRRVAADREAIVYDRYMSPGKVRSEAALDMIASGDPQMFERGKKLLGDALKVRPELEFSEKFNRDKQAAFLQHFRNAQRTDGSNVPLPPSKPKEYSMPFINRPDGFRLPPLLVQPKVAERPTNQPEKLKGVNTNPGATGENGKESDSPPIKPIVIDPARPPKLAGADSSVRFQDLPGGNPFDKSKGYSQKDIEDLAAKGVVALLLAGGAYKLVKKGNEYFFEKQKPVDAEPAKSAPTVKPEPRPVAEKPAEEKPVEAKPNAELEAERAARAEAETRAKTASDTIARLEAEAKADAESRAKLEADAKTNNETIEKLRGEIAKAETDRQAELTRHAAEIERLNAARQADIERTHAEGLAEIERLTGVNKAEVERVTREKDAEIERQKSAVERIEAALADANKAREAKSKAAETQRLQLEARLKQSEAGRTAEQQTADAERQRLETSLKESEAARTAERQTADAQRQQLETSLKESEAARTAERQTADAQRQQLETSLKESEAARTAERQTADAQRQQLEISLKESEAARTTEGEQSKAKLEQTTEQMRGVQGENAELKKQNGLLQAELATAQTSLAEAETKRTSTDKKVTALEGELETARAERDRVTVLAKGDRTQLEANIRSLTEQLQKATEDKATSERTAIESSESQQRQIAELQRKLTDATTKLTESDKTIADGALKLAEKDKAIADDAKDHANSKQALEQQIAELTKRAKQAEQARLAAEQAQKTAEQAQATAERGRSAAEQARTTAEQARATAEQARATAEQEKALAEQAKTSAEQQTALERARAESAEKERDTARSELAAELRSAEIKPAEIKPAEIKQPEIKPVEANSTTVKPEQPNPAETRTAETEQARNAVPQQTEQPTTPRRRIRGGAVQLDTAVIAQNEGNGTYSREVAQGAGIDGKPESKGEKISTDQIQLVKEEIQRLKETKIATDETKAKNLERVLSIIERTDSPRVQEAAHKYIASRILDGESKHAESTGGARATIGRAVSAGIVVSAFLSYYTMREEMLRKGEEVEAPASVGSSKK